MNQDLDTARRLIFAAEETAREAEIEHPEIAPISRAWLTQRILDELAKRRGNVAH